jgi:hypothetical protein
MCSSSGWYSVLAENMGIGVVSADAVPYAIDLLFKLTHDRSLDITPVVMDFRYPTPAAGVANGWFKPATERLKCEMVLFLDAIHKFTFSDWLSFDQVVEGLYCFTARWLLIEFIPRDDILVKKLPDIKASLYADYHWYTERSLISALEYRFTIRDRLPAAESGRVLLLCERKDCI